MATPTWDLPGPRRYLTGVLAHLSEGRPVIAVCPNDTTPVGLSRRVADDAYAADGFEIDHIGADVLDGTRPDDVVGSAVALSDHLRLRRDPGERVGPDTLVAHSDMGERLVVVDARGATQGVAAAWVALSAAVAHAATSVPPIDRARLFVIVGGAGVAVPVAAPNLAVAWWWGVLDSVDVAVALAGSGLGRVATAEAAETGRWDLDLVEACSSRGLTAAVAGRAAAGPPPNGMDLGDYGAAAPAVPGRLRAAWEAGLVESFDGCVDHHLNVAGDLERRRWLAQLRTLFPWLERVRVELAERTCDLGRRHRIDDDEVTSLELAELKTWLYANALKLPRPDWSLLVAAHRARNRLAHLEALSTDELDALGVAASAAHIRAPLL